MKAEINQGISRKEKSRIFLPLAQLTSFLLFP